MSSLRLLNETTVSSAVSSITVDNLFTSDFDIYKVTITAEGVSVTGSNLRFVNSAGAIVVSSQYDKAMQIARANASISELKSTDATELQYFGGVYDPEGGNMVYYIFNPTNSSSYTFIMSQGSSSDGGNGRAYKQIGILTELSSITGLNFVFNDANVDVASIKTYGISNET